MSEFINSHDPDMKPVSFNVATLEGSAPKGGLWVVDKLKKVTPEEIVQFGGLDYPELHTEVDGIFVGDAIPQEKQLEMARGSYSFEHFREVEGHFIGKISRLFPKTQPNILYKNLSSGDTWSFKDNAMLTVAAQTQFFLEELKERRVIVMATSGDTGPAAMSANKGKENVVSFCLVPSEGPSDVQNGQMDELTDNESIFTLAVDGDFTDCQEMVKALNEEFDNLGAVNSINFSRVASQVVYYFSSYYQAIEEQGLKIGDEVNFVVPSGNAGNILAGYLAKRMGLPIGKLIAATNENDTLHQVIQEGKFVIPEKQRGTHSPSMDIRVPNNLLRILMDIAGNDHEKVARYNENVKKYGRLSLEEMGLAPDAMRHAGFESDRCSNDQTLRTMDAVYRASGEKQTVIDPHGATGVYAAQRYIERMKKEKNYEEAEKPIIVLGTADPGKFPLVVDWAIGQGNYRMPDELRRAAERGRTKANFVPMPNDLEMVKKYILAHIEPEFRDSLTKA